MYSSIFSVIASIHLSSVPIPSLAINSECIPKDSTVLYFGTHLTGDFSRTRPVGSVSLQMHRVFFRSFRLGKLIVRTILMFMINSLDSLLSNTDHSLHTALSKAFFPLFSSSLIWSPPFWQLILWEQSHSVPCSFKRLYRELISSCSCNTLLFFF